MKKQRYRVICSRSLAETPNESFLMRVSPVFAYPKGFGTDMFIKGHIVLNWYCYNISDSESKALNKI